MMRATLSGKKTLKGEYEESVWDHSAGTMSAPFEAGEQRQIAVKVIDDRGNELMVAEKIDSKFKIQDSGGMKIQNLIIEMEDGRSLESSFS